MEGVEIRCPSCRWEPDGGAYWGCSKCSYIWNTFHTRGQCPSCGHQHHLTQCIPGRGGCNKLSPHLSWYVGLDESIMELKEVVKESNPATI